MLAAFFAVAFMRAFKVNLASMKYASCSLRECLLRRCWAIVIRICQFEGEFDSARNKLRELNIGISELVPLQSAPLRCLASSYAVLGLLNDLVARKPCI